MNRLQSIAREPSISELGMGTMNSSEQILRGRERRASFARASAVAFAIAAFACGQQSASAGPREQAERMYGRLTGTRPSPALLTALEAEVGGGSYNERVAAAEFMLDPSVDETAHECEGRHAGRVLADPRNVRGTSSPR